MAGQSREVVPGGGNSVCMPGALGAEMPTSSKKLPSILWGLGGGREVPLGPAGEEARAGLSGGQGQGVL